MNNTNYLQQLQSQCKQLPLNELIDLFDKRNNSSSQQMKRTRRQKNEKEFIKLLILSHDDIIHNIQNQSQLIKRMQPLNIFTKFPRFFSFTYENVKLLISFLTHEHSKSDLYAEGGDEKGSQDFSDIGSVSEEKVKNLEIEQSLAVEYGGESRFRDIYHSEYPLEFRLPYKAMQILSCDCGLLTELMLVGESVESKDPSKDQKDSLSTDNPLKEKNSKPPLIYDLLKFLEGKEHYLLAGYFSKVILAITKRVFSPNHKHNSFFCKLVFGGDRSASETGVESGTTSVQNSALFKTVNHMYSLSTLEYIKKWMSLAEKRRIENEDQEDQKVQKSMPSSTFIDFKKQTKQRYLLHLLKHINENSLPNQKLLNICELFNFLLEPQQPSQGSQMAKNLSLNFPKKVEKKTTPYEMATTSLVLKGIMERIDFEHISVAKIKLTTNLITKFKKEEERCLQKQERQGGEGVDDDSGDNCTYNIISQLQIEDLRDLSTWVMFAIGEVFTQANAKVKNIRNFRKGSEEASDSHNGSNVSNAPNFQNSSDVLDENKNCNLNRPEKSILLNFLELIWEIYQIRGMPASALFQYSKMSDEIIQTIIQIMNTKNNLLQLAQSKIVRYLLKWNQIQSGEHSESYGRQSHHLNEGQLSTVISEKIEFGKKLLLQGIPKIIDRDTIREHVVSWAEIILDWDKYHVFENPSEQKDWDHVRELVDQAKNIVIGSCRYKPCNLDFLYSVDKAKLVYSNFFFGFKTQVEYDDGGGSALKSLKSLKKNSSSNETAAEKASTRQISSQKKTENMKQTLSDQKIKEKDQDDESNFFEIERVKSCYLIYDISELMGEFEE